jgi:hypothetical protein
MKKSQILAALILGLAGAIASVPAFADSQSYSFTFSGDGVTISGTLTGTPDSLGDGGDDITGISGNFSNTNVADPLGSGAITGLVPGSYDPSNPTIADGFVFDNLFYPAGDSSPLGSYFDSNGVVFLVGGSAPSDAVNLLGIGGDDYFVLDTYTSYYSLNGGGGPENYEGSFGATLTPEPTSFSLILIGLAGGLCLWKREALIKWKTHSNGVSASV